MGKKSRRTRQKQLQVEGYKPDGDVLRLADELFKRTSSQPGGAIRDEWDDFVAVRKLVDQIVEKQNPQPAASQTHEAAGGSSSRADHFPAFREWLSVNGVDVGRIEFAEFPDIGYGVKAVSDIQQHEPFLTIPQKLMITTLTAKESELGPVIKSDRLLQGMPNIALALHLLCERCNPDSFWRPYIDVLPESYTTPLYYTVDEIKLLEGSPAFNEAMNQSRSVARQYSYLLQLFHNHPDAKGCRLSWLPFTYEDYRWAASSVMTRQNKVPFKDGDDFALALVPGWDMCNHCDGNITTDFSPTEHYCKCYAMKDFPAGSQVVMFYGPRANSEFLIHCGFVYEENRHNRLKMKLGVSKSDHLFAMKAEVLSRLYLPESAVFCISCGSNPFTAEMLAFLRIFCMTQDELLERLRGEQAHTLVQALRNPENIVSDENERKLYSFMQTRCSLLLRQYKSSVEEDTELLGKGELSICAADSVRLRRQDKEILIKAIEFTRSKLESSE